jgi:hypothetical protein
MASESGWHRAASVALAAMIGVSTAAEAGPARQGRAAPHAQQRIRAQQRIDDARRIEGEALMSLTDAAMRGRPQPSDFAIAWHNDFLKAQPGTFVPFTITIDGANINGTRALMHLRVALKGETAGAGRSRTPVTYPFETVVPVELTAGRTPISRGFSVPPGDYDVYITLRERPINPLAADQPRLKSGILRQPITVPDFWTGAMTTSTVMLAERIDAGVPPIAADAMFERPYVIGDNDIHLARDTTFRRDSELLVVFLVYNPMVTPDRDFDVRVDYHLYKRNATAQGTGAAGLDHPAAHPGERYISRTETQRFTRSTVAARTNPSAGDPLMAGQGILLSSFDEGEYRLGITVTDLLSRTTLARDVTFTVIGS